MSESQPVRVGLNGFGRIGRSVLRAVREDDRVEIVAINDVMEDEEMHYLAEYDSVYGRQEGIDLEDGAFHVDGAEIPLLSVSDPGDLPWDEHDVDVAFEATGLFRNYEDASKHLDAGADKTLLSAPPKGERDILTVVYGVNHDSYDGEDVVSNASCTTNSVAAPVSVLNDAFGINSGLLTTVHSYTGTQNLVDGPNSKPRRRRAAAENIIPTTTGAAQSTTEVVPELAGRLDGMAMRVPTPAGSITDLTVDLEADVDREQVHDAFQEAAHGDLEGALGVTDDQIVSRDIVGESRSSLIDARSTQHIENGLTKVLAWYDNEYGFACRMLDVADHIA
jgi:glyceraldehyde 3-phosphate dehydrogenase